MSLPAVNINKKYGTKPYILLIKYETRIYDSPRTIFFILQNLRGEKSGIATQFINYISSK